MLCVLQLFLITTPLAMQYGFYVCLSVYLTKCLSVGLSACMTHLGCGSGETLEGGRHHSQ